MAKRWEGRAPFVAMKSRNRVLKWIQAVTESLGSRLRAEAGCSMEECKSTLAAGVEPKGSCGVVRRCREQVMSELEKFVSHLSSTQENILDF